MFSRKTKSTIDSLIGAATNIAGNVHFKGGLRIDGCVKGDVIADEDEISMLVISEHARVEGEVRSSMARLLDRYFRPNCLNYSRKPA
jgi:cytoskeletal protein CcmA (bactofilin family)